jgi:hypothetical protein
MCKFYANDGGLIQANKQFDSQIYPWDKNHGIYGEWQEFSCIKNDNKFKRTYKIIHIL